MKIKYSKNISLEDVDFYATWRNEDISHLIVENSENNFPYILSMNTLEGFRGKGIMENLLIQARDYYLDNFGKILRSGKYPEPQVIGYYERLEKKGLVQMGDSGRWEFI